MEEDKGIKRDRSRVRERGVSRWKEQNKPGEIDLGEEEIKQKDVTVGMEREAELQRGEEKARHML